MTAYLDPLWRFFAQGGPVTWAILGASLLMWTLILERYWFYWRQLPGERRRREADWQRLGAVCGKPRRRIRAGLMQAHALRIRRFLPSIRALTAVLPLLGLLGTVSGMIDTFDVMAQYGQRNVRGMAGGISQALFTTMAGLMTALSGYYFSVNLEARAAAEERRLGHTLK